MEQQTPYNIPHHQAPRQVHTSGPEPNHRKEGWRSALSTIIILILAPVVAVVLTTFVFQSYEVDGPSMEDTLQNRDRLIVWKVPRTISRLTRNAYIPGRGEVIIFNREAEVEFGAGGEKQLIKRVIALPGERVVLREGQITIYNKEHPKGFDPTREENYGKYAQNTQGALDTVVPKNKVFVLGDNRANSLDSRVFGPVSAEDIVGNLAFRIFPFNKIRAF